MKANNKKNIKPPWFAEFLMRMFFPDDRKFTTVGDLNEVYFNHLEQYGKSSAYLWYWKETFKSITPFIMHSIYLGGAMFKNQWKIMLRNILRHKTYSFINISGLAIGIATCLFIFIWVNYTLEFDRFHENIDNIYWVNANYELGNEKYQGYGTPPATGPALKEKYAEVINSARCENNEHEMMFVYGEKKFKESVKMADLSLLEIFSFPVVKGEVPSDYKDRKVIAIDESTAEKYFGNANPIGKTITVNMKDEFEVVAVFEDIADNSALRYKIIAPLETTEYISGRENYTRTWYNCGFQTFVLLAPGTDYQSLSKQIEKLPKENFEGSNLELYLYPYADLYLYINNKIDNVKLFSAIALLILFIACINFMNLSTARSVKRAKEVGLRKVVGAERKQLILQFFGEAVMMTILSTLIALVLCVVLLPSFNNLTDKNFQTTVIFTKNIILGLIAIASFTGLVSGIYPAVVLSSFKPSKILKGNFSSGTKGKLFRNVLVILQFSFSIFLIVAALVAYQQQQYILNKNLGFQKDQIVTMKLQGDISEKSVTLKNELSKIPEIEHLSLTSHSLTGIYANGIGFSWEGKDPNIDLLVSYLSADSDFLETFKVELSEGKYFDKNGDPGFNILVNESFIKEGKIVNPIGTVIKRGSLNLTIIGVVKDFNFKPLFSKLEPLLISTPQLFSPYHYINFNIKPENISTAITKIEEVYNYFTPEFPFEYTFLSEEFGNIYIFMQRESDLIETFTIIAIFISCLGLLGLASFSAEQKLKEISIRKVLGASTGKVMMMFSVEYAKLILISFLIASPVTYYLVQRWLEDYPYRISLSPIYFVTAGIAAMILAVLSIFYIINKAARTNPATILKNE